MMRDLQIGMNYGITDERKGEESNDSDEHDDYTNNSEMWLK
jgi:hypothetical protein